MNREDFIKAIVERHTSDNDKRLSLLIDDYKQVLRGDVDYDDLFTQYLHEYTLKSYPAPAWFAQRMKYKEKQKENNNNLLSVYAIINGLKYEFGYDKEVTSEEQAQECVKKRKGCGNAIFITQKEFRGY